MKKENVFFDRLKGFFYVENGSELVAKIIALFTGLCGCIMYLELIIGKFTKILRRK